jgi:hypothetical protein
MHDPFIHKLIEIQRTSSTKFGVFAKDFIARGTLIESCAILPIPKTALVALQKVKSSLLDRVLPNPDGIRKEREITGALAEMEIQRRLDEGTLTPAEAKDILLGPGNLTSLLEVETICLLTGYGSLYNKSSYPNIRLTFDSETKLYDVFTVKDVGKGTELTYLSA